MAILEQDVNSEQSASQSIPRSLTLDDVWRIRGVSDIQPSPDASAIAYVVSTTDESHNDSHSAIWLLELGSDGLPTSTKPKQFTSGATADMQPRWSPDGKRLVFVSTRHEGKPQLFLIDRNGGEPRRLTDDERGAGAPVWSPDGTKICYGAAVETDRQTVPQEDTWLEAHPDAKKDGPRLRRQATLQSRFDGRGYVDKRAHLFLIDVEEANGETTGRQITEGDCDDAEAIWSPDGALIAFTSNRGDEWEHSLRTDIWTVEVETGKLKRLTAGNLMAGSPSWSPDGSKIAFYACPDWSDAGYRDTHLWLVSRDGGDQRDISSSVDLGHRHVQPDYTFPEQGIPAWSPDGSTVYFTLIDHGDDTIYAADLSTGTVKRLSDPGTDVFEIHPAGDGSHLYLLAVRPDHPFDVFEVPATGGAPQPLISTNAELLEGTELITPEHVTATGPKGWPVEGWLYRPDGVERPPLVLHVHGGPYGAWGESFYFQAQVLAGLGYASLYVNPRGSLGYGQEFSAAADWGQDDFRDLLAVIDAVVDAGKADPDRIGITGISYGGFMTDWALGNSDRFAVGVSVNGVSNQVSMYGVSDMASIWLPHEFGGNFFDDDAAWERYRRSSPITYVDRIEAPLLLIQSENDYRCPIEQGEQMLTALRMRRKTVELVRFPGCSHVIAESGTPLQRYLQWKLAFDWFDTYLLRSKAPQPAKV